MSLTILSQEQATRTEQLMALAHLNIDLLYQMVGTDMTADDWERKITEVYALKETVRNNAVSRQRAFDFARQYFKVKP